MVILAGVLVGLPDVDLVSLGGGTLRLFDLLTVVVAGLGLGRLASTPLTAAHRTYLTWCGLGLVAAMNGALHFGLPPLTGLLFALRPIQYLVVGLALVGTIRQERSWRLFAATVLACISMSIVLDLLLVQDAGATGRIGVTFGGPFELACVAAGLGLVAYHRYGSVAQSSAFFLIVALSASRITVAVVIVLGLYYGVRQIYRHPSWIAGVVGAAALFAGLSWLVSGAGVHHSIVGRFTSTGVLDEYRVSGEVADSLIGPETYATMEFDTITTVKRVLPADPAFDRSSLLRFTRWRLLLERQGEQWSTRLLGLGPGGGSQAVDGYFVRLVVETGWIGFVVFGAFVVALVGQARAAGPDLLAYVVVMLGSALFVDVLVASKAMTLLWLLVGNQPRR